MKRGKRKKVLRLKTLKKLAIHMTRNRRVYRGLGIALTMDILYKAMDAGCVTEIDGSLISIGDPIQANPAITTKLINSQIDPDR